MGGHNRYGVVSAVSISPPELPIIEEARNDTHISTTRVRLYQHKKNETVH